MRGERSDASRSRARLTAGVIAHRDELLQRIVARASTEFEGYLRFGGQDLAPGAGVILDLLLVALHERRGPTSDELTEYRDYGRGRAEMGIPLSEVLGVWRMSSREILAELDAVARASRVQDGVLLVLTNELLDTFDVAIRAYTAGHQEVELARAGREHQARVDFVRAALTGLVDPLDIGSEAARWGLADDEPLFAFRSRASLHGAQSWLAKDALVAAVDGDLAGIVRERPRSVAELAVGVGDPEVLGGLPRSFGQATTCLATAVAFGLHGVFDHDSLGLLPAVAADLELGDRLVRRYLEPLGSGPAATRLRETLECHVGNGLRVERTAADLYLHENTVRYRMRRFSELTGIDLREPQRVFELWWALQRSKISA